MAKEKTDVVITKELQDTVRLHDGKGNGKHRLIKNVYFDENGNHYFNKYTVKLHEVDDSGNVTKVKDVECLGSTETIVHIIQKGVGGKVTGVKDMKAVTSVIGIYSSYTRDEILNAKAVSKPKSEKEKLEILKAASEIAKEGGFEELMEKLKK